MRALVVFVFVSLLAGCWPGETAERDYVAAARSIDVLDGDSLVIKRGRHETEIRLHGIDAPEHRQPWAREARAALRKLVAGRDLRIVPVTTDRFERTVAHVYRVADGLYVNAALVSAGHAWVYRRYTDDRDLIARQAQAQAQGAGLWQLPPAQRQPPWLWRREQQR